MGDDRGVGPLARIGSGVHRVNVKPCRLELRAHLTVRPEVRDRTQLRPPYGSWNTNTRLLGKALILWSVDTLDQDGCTAAQIRSLIAANTRSGSIVLMHASVTATVDAVPGIITDLRARGFTLVRVEDLLPNLGPGDVDYNRSQVTRAHTSLDQRQGTLESPDGADLSPVIDEAPFVPEPGTTPGD